MAKVYINGLVSEPEEAKISVYDRGFLFGDAVYEVVRSYGKILFTVEQHLERLYRSAMAIGLNIGVSQDDFLEKMYHFYWKEHKDDVYIRIQISRGSVKKEQINLQPENFDSTNIVMYLHDLKLPSKEQYEKGISLQSAEYLRNSKRALDPNIKSGNYLNNILALKDLDHTKYQDRFLLDQKGFVTEGTTFNIFMVKNGVIFTSPDQSDILHGITRGIVFHCADKINIELRQDNFNLKQVLNADEVFITSSTKEILPVTRINLHPISDAKVGPVTKKLSTQYKNFIEEYLKKAKTRHNWNPK